MKRWRLLPILLIVPGTALGISGCGHSDSASDAAELPQSTQVSYEPETNEDQPGYIDCIQPPAVRPGIIHIDCTSDEDTITNIKWNTWDSEKADGIGTRIRPNKPEQLVEITLTMPIQVTGGWAFSAQDFNPLKPQKSSSTPAPSASTKPSRP